jgi:hypothetical protein
VKRLGFWLALILTVSDAAPNPLMAATSGFESDSCTILEKALREDFQRTGKAEFLTWSRESKVAQAIATRANLVLENMSDDRRALIRQYLDGNYHNFDGIRDRVSELVTAQASQDRTDCGDWETYGDPDADFRDCQHKVDPSEGKSRLSRVISLVAPSKPAFQTILRRRPRVDSRMRARINEQIQSYSKDKLEVRICHGESDDLRDSINMCYALNLEDLASRKTVALADVLGRNQKKTEVPSNEDAYVVANLSCGKPVGPARGEMAGMHPGVSDRSESRPTAAHADGLPEKRNVANPGI